MTSLRIIVKNTINALTASFAFLTIIPINKVYDDKTLGHACAFFPVVGFFLGVLTASFSLLYQYNVSPFIIAAGTIIIPLLLTGGLHFDALLDSCDGLYGQKDIASRLRIMRDSSTGAMGVLGGISLVLFKFSILLSLPKTSIFYAVIGSLVFSRFIMVFCCAYIPYARKEGKGEIFTAYTHHKEFIIATMMMISITAILFKIKTFLILGLSIIFTSIFIIYSYKKIKGITGDTIGATSEIAEVALLTSFYISTL